MREPNDLLELGRAVRAARTVKGLTQERLAETSGLHVTYIAGIEGGKRNPSFRSLQKIALGLGISLSELLTGIDGP